MKKAITLIMVLCLAATLIAGCQPAVPVEHVHTLVHNEEKAPNCVNNGILEHWYCPACNARFSDAEGTTEVTFADLEVEELGHTGGEATCTEQPTCERCEKPYGAALGHTWDDAEAAVKNCTVCGIHVNASFAGGKGTAEEPYLIKDAKQLLNISNFYDTYKYYKVADGVETIDMAGQGKILLNGSFDGNGVKIVNLNTALFLQAGYQNTAADIKISNLDVTMNVTDGCALVRNIFNSGKTTFENVAIHGYIEGQYNMGSFFNYGTANYGNGGADYTVELVKSVSDATIVCTGGVPGGFFGHTYEGAGNSFTMIIDSESAFTGKILTTNGKGNLYFAMTSDYNNTNNHFIINGEEVKFNNGQIPAAANTAKIAIKAPTAGESAYEVEAVEGATEFIVSLSVQVTAYDEEGYMIVNKNGLTWPLSRFGMDELAEMGLINSLVIVNGTDHDMSYEIADGVLTVYSGRSDSYESGKVYLQINQYNAEGELLATGTLTVCTLEHDHTFVGTSCTTNGKCNCGTTQKAPGHDYKATVTAPTCTAAGYTTYTCSVCSDSYKGDEKAPIAHSFGDNNPTCTACGAENPDYVPPETEPPVEEPTVAATITNWLVSGTFVDDKVWPAGNGDGSSGPQLSCDASATSKWNPQVSAGYAGEPGIIYTLDGWYDLKTVELTFDDNSYYFKVFGSSDGVSFTELATVNADNAGSVYAGNIATVTVNGKAVRYIKVNFTGRAIDMNFVSLYNVAASGVAVTQPAAAAQPETKKVTITGHEIVGTFTKESTPANSYDGNASTKWSPETNSNYTGLPGVIYTLDNAYDIAKLELDCSGGKKLFVTILGSADGENYVALGAVGVNNMSDIYGDDNIATINVAAEGIRYIKVIFNGRDGSGQWIHLNEIAIFGKA